MRKFLKLKILALTLTACAALAEAKENNTRVLNNLNTFDVLRTTPVSILEIGLFRLEREFEKADYLYKNIRLAGETVAPSIFTEYKETEIGLTPIIKLHTTLFSIKGVRKTSSSAQVACGELLRGLRIWTDSYIGTFGPNPFLNFRLDLNDHNRYKALSRDDISSLIYLSGMVAYGEPLEKKYAKCGELYK